MVDKNGEQIVETAIDARGAERDPTMRNVLVWSLGLVAERRCESLCHSMSEFRPINKAHRSNLISPPVV